MLSVATLGLILFAPADPVPVPPPAANVGPVDRGQAVNFAYVVHSLAARVQDEYARDVKMADLIVGAVRGLYDEAGVPLPDEVLRAVRHAGDNTELVNALVEARVRLGNHPRLNGAKSLFAAIGGFRYALDPGCALVNQRGNPSASIDQDFGIGIELDGASGVKWVQYQVEYATALRWYQPVGYFGPVPAPDEIPPPMVGPWRVKRVIPGSPAQRAGVKPGDTITHLNGTAITAENAGRQFIALAFPPGTPGPGLPSPPGIGRVFKITRQGNPKPIIVELTTENYAPECLFGVMRRDDGSWDCLLDREQKFGYIRVGPVENGADETMTEMIDGLISRGCRGLILDFRWCPGGYLVPATRIAGLFVPKDSEVVRVEYRNPNQNLSGDLPRTATDPRYPQLPIVLLVGSETTGGGELIAAALQDNIPDRKRLVTMGQRTVGRAFISNTTEVGFGGLQYRMSKGISFRPNGKPRQRTETSQPTDDWGVRPDPGMEVPVTADLMADLRLQAELHALRPAESNESLPFDDPAKDPFRWAALEYLRKKLNGK